MPATIETGSNLFVTEDAQVNLRFVEREAEGRKVRILQQAWVITQQKYGTSNGPEPIARRVEWRDVPCVDEE